MEVEIQFNAYMEEPAVLEVCMWVSPELTLWVCSRSLGYRVSPVSVKKASMPGVFGLPYLAIRKLLKLQLLLIMSWLVGGDIISNTAKCITFTILHNHRLLRSRGEDYSGMPYRCVTTHRHLFEITKHVAY